MKIAIPVENGRVSAHFGHAPQFLVALTEEGKIVRTETHENPGHEPGKLPTWLAGLGVKAILAGGMGERAISLFQAQGIQVCVGVSGAADEVLRSFLQGRLEGGESLCTHVPGTGCSHGGGGCAH
ncbi:MAG: dinitrogenase iron-molybdenum cofactor [Synergistaceae bacterium]|nr:dinitrogenase iron-molybdenum cofactor [Synergistaceae bacterium]